VPAQVVDARAIRPFPLPRPPVREGKGVGDHQCFHKLLYFSLTMLSNKVVDCCQYFSDIQYPNSVIAISK